MFKNIENMFLKITDNFVKIKKENISKFRIFLVVAIILLAITIRYLMQNKMILFIIIVIVLLLRFIGNFKSSKIED